MNPSPLEDGLTPLGHGHLSAQVRGRHGSPHRSARTDPSRHDDIDPLQPAGPVDWHDMLDDEYVETFDALTEFLTWAVPHWGFTSDQFPYRCWWQHSDIIEEMTAWWTMWQAYIHNPAAHPADPIAFHERTWTLKQRLADAYRGRCRHEHTPSASPAVTRPRDADAQ